MAHRSRAVLSVVILVTVGTGSAVAQVDLTGEWAARLHEEVLLRRDPPGPSIGDYTGLPVNDAARLKADSWDASILSLREHQTTPSSAIYWARSLANMRITPVVDRTTQQVTAYTIYRSPGTGAGGTTRTIWMDDRPHPPAYAAHTWLGFSTGRWDGQTLVVETTHIKMGMIQRNGLPHSDEATMTERFMRHGDVLTVVSIADDQEYFEEPLVRTTNWVIDPTQQLEPIPTRIVDEVAGHPEGYVPHHLPGANPYLNEFADHVHLPVEATRGGARTMYPEYQQRLRELTQPHP
jgi:hypothetical protein